MSTACRRKIDWRWARRISVALFVVAIVTTLASTDVLAQRSPGRSGAGGGAGGSTLPTTPNDFFQPGTQPLGEGSFPLAPFVDSSQCASCHGGYDPAAAPHDAWKVSMMAQSARDPIFHAKLAIANQDAAGAGEFCIRCHVPVAFLEGRADPPDGSAFIDIDFDGINCNFCHRVVDPDFKPGVSPEEDEAILASLDKAGYLPGEAGNARYVFDPTDARRGPRSDYPFNFHPGNPQPEMIESPIHTQAEFCWNCHDVSNPLLVRNGGAYVLGSFDEPHPTADQFDMFPLHRTYSEWKNSYYSTIGINHQGRFGGDHPTGVMKACQDCHMPMTSGYSCSAPILERPDIPQHHFLGSNTWVLRAVRDLYPNAGLSEQEVEDAIARNIDFLERAADLTLAKVDASVRARIINRTGHKLPTGFPDGRRMWLNVKFLAPDGSIIEERGGYDFETATLDAAGTTVYEAILGIDAAQAAATGHPQGHTFHFMLANQVLKDNRIPPPGWLLAEAQQKQTMPVGATYVNGQHWDDVFFEIPPQAHKAVVALYYQTTSREFIEFLRDADSSVEGFGQIAYDLWDTHGKSQPVVMDMAEIVLTKLVPGDLNGDGVVDVQDLLLLLSAWGTCPKKPQPCPADLNDDGSVDVQDLLILLNNWG